MSTQSAPATKILHLSTEDVTGGAALAAYRLHSALRASGYASRMLVAEKKSSDPDVIEAPRRALLSAYRRARHHFPGDSRPATMFNRDRAAIVDMQAVLPERPDVLMLHWVTNLLAVEDVHALHRRYRCPIFWVLMDLEPLTGGCHYTLGCDRYMERCGSCPQLRSDREEDRSRTVWERKRARLSELPITFISGNDWITTRVRKSSLFGDHPVHEIPLPMDLSRLRPVDARFARGRLGLPSDRKIILAGASDLAEGRKGMRELVRALHHLAERLDHSGSDGPRREDFFVLMVGAEGRRILEQLPFPGEALGYVSGETLTLAYQAADLFVSPSLEDAGPMMVSEAMLCGTPVVAFDTGVAREVLHPMRTGYVAENGDAEDLARGIHDLFALGDLPAMREVTASVARERHSPDRVIRLYGELFSGLPNRSVDR